MPESANQFEAWITAQRKLVWREVQGYLTDPIYPAAFAVPEQFAHEAQTHWEIVKDYPERRGKYLRPLLLLLVAQAMGASASDALKTAAAMQISEEWLLIHDDLEDDSPLRRGKPTLHKLHGIPLATNAGDTLHVIMWKVLQDNYQLLGHEKALRLQQEFSTMLMRTALGQSTELQWAQANKADLTDDDWFFIADGKTAYYTIAAPMRLGAMIAGANQAQLDALAQCGVHLGRNFQLMDDLLDLTGDTANHKQVGNDIYEGKRTVMLGHLLRTADAEAEQKLLAILAKPRAEKTADEVEWVIAAMHAHGSIAYAEDLAKQQGNQALELFNQLSFLATQSFFTYLEHFLQTILHRQQ